MSDSIEQAERKLSGLCPNCGRDLTQWLRWFYEPYSNAKQVWTETEVCLECARELIRTSIKSRVTDNGN